MSTKQSSNKSSVSLARKISVGAMLSAVGFILMYLELSVPIVPSFLKLDASDLPALLASYALGPVCGVTVALVKNLLHLPFTSSFGVGELSNFILCSTFVFPAGLVYHFKKTKKTAIFGAFVGLVVMSIMAVPSNLYLIFPLYYKLGFSEDAIFEMYTTIANSFFPFMHLDSMAECILYFNVPFTFVKALISTIITIFIYQPLRPILKGRN